MEKRINVTAGKAGDSWLLIGSEKTAVIDTGMEYCSEKLAENIREILGDRPLDYVFLTHSHYDHVSGLPALRKMWPNLIAAAHPHAAKILAKESAIEFMRDMSANAYRLYDPEHSVVGYPVTDYRVDLILEDNMEISLGDLTVRAIWAPGHTKCSIAFYIPEQHLLFPSETPGLPAAGYDTTIEPNFLTSYVSAMDSIRKLRKLDVRAVIPAHNPYQDGIPAQTFLSRAAAFTELSRDFILGMHINGMSQEEILKVYSSVYSRQIGNQPMKAFLVNAEAAIRTVIREYEAGEIHF